MRISAIGLQSLWRCALTTSGTGDIAEETRQAPGAAASVWSGG